MRALNEVDLDVDVFGLEDLGLDQSFVTLAVIRRERCFCRVFSCRWWGSRYQGIKAPRAMAALRTIQGRAQQVCPRTVASIFITVVMGGKWYSNMSSTWMVAAIDPFRVPTCRVVCGRRTWSTLP
jgi:hypothetical protein